MRDLIEFTFQVAIFIRVFRIFRVFRGFALTITTESAEHTEKVQLSSDHWLRSSTGFGSRLSSHFLQLLGLKVGSVDSITHERNSFGPPFRYGGGETGLNTVGRRS